MSNYRRSTLIGPLSASSTVKTRQLSHLHSQLSQLQANIADLDNLLDITVTQANAIKKLGIYHSSLFMATYKISEEEQKEMDAGADVEAMDED